MNQRILKVFILIIQLTSLFLSALADKKRIKICFKETNMSNSYDKNYWENYGEKLKNFFAEKVKDNEKLKDYVLDIYVYSYYMKSKAEVYMYSFNSPEIIGYTKDLGKRLLRGEYDMVVIDDRILFSEYALIESDQVAKNMDVRYPSSDLLHDLTKYIDKKDLEFHDPKIVSGGMYNDRIIGLPYETDFDVMYFPKEESDTVKRDFIQSLLDNMESYTWRNLITKVIHRSLPFRISLYDDYDVMNYIIEYTSCLYNLSYDYDPYFYKIFYNETSIDYYTDFTQFIYDGSEDEEARWQIFTKMDDLFVSFLKGETTIFTARASNMLAFEQNNKDYIPSLPPKYKTATLQNYLVANKYSKISPDVLAEVALILTSKEAQLLRAESFATVPTFDFTRNSTDTDIQNYCKKRPFICDSMEKMDKLYVRDIFSNDHHKYMVPFYEVMNSIPQIFKLFFRLEELPVIRNSMFNMYEFVTNNLQVYKTLTIILISVVIAIFIFTIFMTYHLREHPFIKVISPIFCNLIVAGCIINSTKVLKFIPPYSYTKIKLFLILETLGTNLIFIPMFAVAYRIYRIFKAKTLISIGLNDKRLILYVIATICVSLIYHLVIIFSCDFYYESVGSLKEGRVPIGYYTHHDILHKIYQIYLTFIVKIKINF